MAEKQAHTVAIKGMHKIQCKRGMSALPIQGNFQGLS